MKRWQKAILIVLAIINIHVAPMFDPFEWSWAVLDERVICLIVVWWLIYIAPTKGK